jgi:hypothetical protein
MHVHERRSFSCPVCELTSAVTRAKGGYNIPRAPALLRNTAVVAAKAHACATGPLPQAQSLSCAAAASTHHSHTTSCKGMPAHPCALASLEMTSPISRYGTPGLQMAMAL